jgi:hypothetical protein
MVLAGQDLMNQIYYNREYTTKLTIWLETPRAGLNAANLLPAFLHHHNIRKKKRRELPREIEEM